MTQENMKINGKVGLLTECFVNENIGRKYYNQ